MVPESTLRKKYLQPRNPIGNGDPGAAMRIAIQGEPGSFSHEAAMKLVAGATIVPCSLSADAFSALVNGSVDAAVIPIENSLAGSVSEHFDLLLAHDVTVERETLLRIRHNLIASPALPSAKSIASFLTPSPWPSAAASSPTTPAWSRSPSTTPPAASSNSSNSATAMPRPSPARPPPTTTARRSFRPALKTIRKTTPVFFWFAAPGTQFSIPIQQDQLCLFG